jgi:hypothetical protein
MADDDESLDEILSGTPKAEPEAKPEAEPQPTDPPRDEHGRFAPKEGEETPEAATEEPEAEAEPQPEAEHNAPVAAVIAERRKAQAANERAEQLAREIAEMRGQMSVLMQRGNQPPAPQPEPVKPPDFWDAPDKYVEHALSPVQQQLAEMTFRTSRAEAFAEHGKETVTAAEAAMKQAVESGKVDGEALRATLRQSRDPVGYVVQWHLNSPSVQQATMRETIRAELMAELGIDPNKPTPSPAPSERNPIVKMPPSLNRIPAGHNAPERDESLDEVLSVPRRRA